ncbi:MAG TPA: type II toxin-antitoxin system VapC family toxin [Thermomicrobiales bacterium]|nr:type II toxin-antitoxin system VapC family toxin [Thermomicrobiales bacterium]
MILSYLFDTDRVIDFLNAQPDAHHLVARFLPAGIAISIVTYAELLEGILGSHDVAEGERELHAFLRSVAVLDISRPVARRVAEIRLDLRHRGRPVNNRIADLFIAATALHHDLMLVTRNTRDYEDIPGLVVH